MGDYVRTTRECSLASMTPALAAALRAYAEKYALGNLDSTAELCCETVSKKQKKGLFGKAEVVLSGVVVTPQWLVWAAGKENETPGVLSARLRDIHVQDYEKTDRYRLMPDTGLSITGMLHLQAAEVGSAFIGLGPEPAATNFRAALRAALAKAA